jgi:hypothetical protein
VKATLAAPQKIETRKKDSIRQDRRRNKEEKIPSPPLEKVLHHRRLI